MTARQHDLAADIEFFEPSEMREMYCSLQGPPTKLPEPEYSYGAKEIGPPSTPPGVIDHLFLRGWTFPQDKTAQVGAPDEHGGYLLVHVQIIEKKASIWPVICSMCGSFVRVRALPPRPYPPPAAPNGVH